MRRFSNDGDSLRCPACKSHVSAADLTCPVCGEVLPKVDPARKPNAAAKTQSGTDNEVNRNTTATRNASMASRGASDILANGEAFTNGHSTSASAPAKPRTQPMRPVQPAPPTQPMQPVSPAKPPTNKQVPLKPSAPVRSISPVASTAAAKTATPTNSPSAATAAPAPPGNPSELLAARVHNRPSLRWILAAAVAVCALVLGIMLMQAGLFNNQNSAAVAGPTPVAQSTVKIAVVFAQPTAPEGTAQAVDASNLDGVAVMPPQTVAASAVAVAAVPITPTETVAPVETATIEPTRAPTGSPTATATPEPTSTSISEPTDEPTSTAAATSTPRPSSTATVAPTASPLPSATPEPSSTPTRAATATSAPTATPRPTSTPAPTNTPAPANEPIAYVVRDGDSCLVIARQFGITVARLVAYNGLNPNTCFIRTGMTVLIPPGEARPTATPLPTRTPVPTATQVTGTPYRVLPGDTCLEIAQRFNISVNALATANQLNRSTCFINAGRTLIIPSGEVAPDATLAATAIATEVRTAPALTLPSNGAAVPANQSEVQLAWQFERALAYDEYFIVQIQPSGAAQVLIFQTKSKTIGVPRDALPAASQNVRWQVQVRRVVAGGTASTTNALTFEDIGPPSATWSFRWP